ncbi:TPA: hypothetical protein HA238_06595 [Candidatus Micrarchaeota archaeon]|nr:hypothetical protein [Candidatus Micrarchaeota archaeon]
MPEEKKETGGIKEIKDAKKNGNQNPAQSPSPPQTPPQPEKSEEERKKDERMAALIKEIEQAFFAFRFYPVATKEDSRIQAENRIIDAYAKEDDTVKQMILYMIHENLSQAADMKTMHNFEHFKRKLPTADPSQIRINVYRAMFNYNFSLEGLIALVRLLGRLEGDDAAKLLTYHFTFFSSIEAESMHMLKNAVIDTLGESTSPYALKSLLEYATCTEREQTLQRIASALAKWDQKIDGLKLSKKEKDGLTDRLRQILTLEFGDSHYG